MKSIKMLTILVLVLGLISSALTGEKIQDITQGGEKSPYASNPDPANGATVTLRINQNTILRWDPVDTAVSYNVYFGNDEDAVRNATTSSTEYKGNKALGSESYDPGNLAWGTTYYWRIDAVDNLNPDSPWTGPVWSMRTDDFIIVDDFERYNDTGDYPVWSTWLDGYGYGMPGEECYYPGNGTGSMGGINTWSPYKGEQSGYFIYDNTIEPHYSEVFRTLDRFEPPQEYISPCPMEYILIIMGMRESSNTFSDNSDGTYKMTGSGDDFGSFFAYIHGPDSIQAKIDWGSHTNFHGKAGVMFREELDPYSSFFAAYVTTEKGVNVELRPKAGGPSYTYPLPLSLAERYRLGLYVKNGQVEAKYSADGEKWEHLTGEWPPFQIGKNNYYGGLFGTNKGRYEILFSYVETIPDMGGMNWLTKRVDDHPNDPAPIYIVLTDGSGGEYYLEHPDPFAVQYKTWTPWHIRLDPDADFNFWDVSQFRIGVGNPFNPQPDGWGILNFDDIRLQPVPEEQPEEEPEEEE